MTSLWMLFASAFAGDVLEVLQDDQVRVRCGDSGAGTVCVAESFFSISADPIVAVLEDLLAWPEVFSTVDTVVSVGPRIYAVDVSLPFPLGRWPFVARVEHRVHADGHTVELFPLGDPTGLWTAATWEVIPHGTGSWVTYTWRTDALRSLPAFARRALHRRTGHNTLWGVALAAGVEPTLVAPVE